MMLPDLLHLSWGGGGGIFTRLDCGLPVYVSGRPSKNCVGLGTTALCWKVEGMWIVRFVSEFPTMARLSGQEEAAATRAECLERYRDKKRRRLIHKTIRYHKRKVNADNR